MYCPNCGKDSMQGARFCESCGTALPATGQAPTNGQQYAQAPPQYQSAPQYQAPPPYQGAPAYGQPMYAAVPMKNTGIAAVLALIIPGAGHIYLGRIGEGLMYLILAIILGIFFWLIIPAVILLVLWIWQIYDAYNKANQYNAAVQQTGRAPW